MDILQTFMSHCTNVKNLKSFHWLIKVFNISFVMHLLKDGHKMAETCRRRIMSISKIFFLKHLCVLIGFVTILNAR